MRISALTVILIAHTLFSLSLFFMYKGLFNIQDEFCGNIEPKDSAGASDFEFAAWKDCWFTRQDMHIKYGLTMFASILLVFLTILSWKVDHIKGK